MTSLPKANLRRDARRLRKELAATATMGVATHLAGNFLEGPLAAWKETRQPVIAGYWPFGTEIDTKPLLMMLIERGYEVVLPVTDTVRQALLFRKWAPGMDLVSDGMGMKCPPPTAPMMAPDIMIAAALAFDRSGHRMGYGTGYYDMTINSLRAARPIVAVTVAYAGQEVDTINPGPHDEKVDWIVTEQYAFKIE
jgi:5-formyltetrahydrofolate cyclo-ligase